MDTKQIGQQIRQRRKSLNVSQPTLAALSGISVNTLVSIERGEGNPRLDSVMSVLDSIGLQFIITLKD